jgi:hypothetical protein
MGVPQRLVRKSTLTETQLESLESYVKVVKKEIVLREGAAQRAGGGVSVGSYYRTVQQARTKIKESMATVLIGLLVGVVGPNDVRRLFDMVGRAGTVLQKEDEERFAQLVDALVDKLVM